MQKAPPTPKGFRDILPDLAKKRRQTINQIADILEVDVNTIRAWKEKMPEFKAALQKGGIHADMNVVRALYRKAVGYKYTETLKIYRDGEVVRQEVCEKEHPPDVYACIRWLAMRQRDSGNWTETQKAEITYAGGVDVRLIAEQLKNLTQFTEAELQVVLKMGLAKIAERAGN